MWIFNFVNCLFFYIIFKKIRVKNNSFKSFIFCFFLKFFKEFFHEIFYIFKNSIVILVFSLFVLKWNNAKINITINCPCFSFKRTIRNNRRLHLFCYFLKVLDSIIYSRFNVLILLKTTIHILMHLYI